MDRISRDEIRRSVEAEMAKTAFHNGESHELGSLSRGGNGSGEYETARCVAISSPAIRVLKSVSEAAERYMIGRSLKNLTLGGVMRSL